jgi:cytochrome c peroxidase
LNNPAVTDPAEKDKFKVPTLRNVAVSGPYMHNGVFRNLQTVIEFNDFMNNGNRVNNPEAGAPWEALKVAGTVATDLLKVGDSMTDDRVEALVCFLRTLTDRRYEHLVQDKGIDCN